MNMNYLAWLNCRRRLNTYLRSVWCITCAQRRGPQPGGGAGGGGPRPLSDDGGHGHAATARAARPRRGLPEAAAAAHRRHGRRRGRAQAGLGRSGAEGIIEVEANQQKS